MADKDYKGAQLDGSDFSGRDLTGSDFRGASLIGANFRNAFLKGAQFRGADVTDADFQLAAITEADFVGIRGGESAIWPPDFDLDARTTSPPKTDRTETERLLQYYFREDGTLKELPVGWTRQAVVLNRIVTRFEAGVRYSEKEVSEQLKSIHPDFASLRRYLIDHQLMRRENNVYWRAESDCVPSAGEGE